MGRLQPVASAMNFWSGWSKRIATGPSGPSGRRVGRCYIGRLMARTAVTVETVDHVARLAHLSLTTEERETFTRQLAQVLDYAEALQALDTSDVPPMSHAGLTGDFRADTPGARETNGSCHHPWGREETLSSCQQCAPLPGRR